jgi:hypothetical protein
MQGAIIASVALFWPVAGWAGDVESGALFSGVQFSDAVDSSNASLEQTAKKISAELKRKCEAWQSFSWTGMPSSVQSGMPSSVQSQMDKFRGDYTIQPVDAKAVSAGANNVRIFKADGKHLLHNAHLTFVWTDNARDVSICGNKAALVADMPPLTTPTKEVEIGETGHNLANPLYQTLEGQIYSSTRTLWNWASVRLYNRRNGATATQSTESLGILQFLRYGVTNDLSISGNIEYDPISSTTTQSGAGEATQKKPGWGSPEFQIYYQALSQWEGDPLYLNIGPQYSPGWISPNEHFQFQERVGYETTEWAVEFGELTTYNWTTGSNVARLPDWEVRLGLDGFYEMSKRWSANASVADNIVLGQNGHGNANLQGQVNYYLVPDKLQLSLVYQYRFVGAYANRDNQSGGVAGIQLTYLYDVYVPDR